MNPSAEDIESLTRAVGEAESGTAQSVALSGTGRAALRDVLIRGALKRAWLMIESELPVFRVAVRTRGPGAAGVSGILEDDHRRLDDLAAALVATKGGEPERSQSLGLDFAYGLRHHIRIEEELLFELFDARSGMRGHGPTAVMRAEHAQILPQLDRLERGVKAHAAGDASAWREVVEAIAGVGSVLEPHNMKEEQILYPMLDQMIAGPEQAETLARLVLWE